LKLKRFSKIDHCCTQVAAAAAAAAANILCYRWELRSSVVESLFPKDYMLQAATGANIGRFEIKQHLI
jgi:hypothetical protein